MKPATSADVAARAGVSRATVSYVLNDRPGISIPEATRQRVREAAAALDYVPNHSARALRGQAPPVILVISRSMPFGRNIGDVMDTLTALATVRGFSLVTFQTGSSSSLELTLAHLRPRLALAVVGLEDADREVIERLGTPWVDGWSGVQEVASGAAVTEMQVAALVAAGRTRLAYFGAVEESLGIFEADRRAGVAAACARRGLPAPREHRVPQIREDADTALGPIVRDWVRGPEPVDGVVCYNDFWAGALLAAAHAEGVRVPEDLAVIGLDDEPMAAFLEPPLTTIALDAEAIAHRLFARGLAQMGESPTGEETTAGLRMIRRRSV